MVNTLCPVRVVLISWIPGLLYGFFSVSVFFSSFQLIVIFFRFSFSVSSLNISPITVCFLISIFYFFSSISKMFFFKVYVLD